MSDKILYVIDLDRTLVDVNQVMSLTEVVCRDIGINFTEIYKQQQSKEKEGVPYSPLEYINSYQNQGSVFKRKFIELARDERLLFDDATSLLEYLKNKQKDAMILTYGAEKEWQELKLSAASLNYLPRIITKDRSKSRVINSWMTEQGEYFPNLEGLSTYESCVLIDDHSIAFDGFPSDCVGYLLDRTKKYTQKQSLAKNVKIIHKLSDISIS